MSQHGCPERLSNRSKGFQEDGPSQPTMEVLVETLTGTAFEMTVSPSDTIFAIKSKIYRVEGIPVSQQHLLYNLKELEDSSSLCELAIADGARLRLVLGMRGGPISTRRLPPPAPVSAEPWPDIERFIDSHNRIDDIEWSGSGSSGGSGSGSGSGCKVTVLVFRDGERVNMLRVKENHDGTYSPLDINKYTCRVTQTAERGVGTSERGGVGGVAGQAGVVEQNAVTAGKMLELRRRMEGLSLQRGNTAHRADDSTELQKTRSEESLVSPRLGLLDEPDPEAYGRHGDAPEPYPRLQPYAGHEDAIAHMYDTNYTRYEMEMCVGGGYTLVPAGPIEPPPGFPPVPQHAPMPFPPPAPAPAPAPTSARRHTPPQPATNTRRQNVVDAEETSILEECLATEECLRRDSPPRLQPVPATEYGPLVGGSGWRGGGGGGGGGCGGHGAHAHSASALQLRCAAPHAPRPPLEDALFSSSTSDLENLKRNSSRILPALSRHRNRSQLHLSDEGLHLSRREVGSERRQRRIDKIAQLDARLLRFSDSVPAVAGAGAGVGAGEGEGEPAVPAERDNADGKEKKIRIRCGLCKKRLSIATVHRCRCGAPFCAPHRYAEVHGCAYDYKGTPAAPHALPINKPKLPKI